MGKRIEKAFGREKGQASTASQDNNEDDPNRTPEPYLCTGLFQSDFNELCRRNNMAAIPIVIPRAHRPPSPSMAPPAEEKTKAGRGKDDKKNQPPPEPEPEQELDENGEAIEPPPKTYVTKDKFEYFKPSVQVEMDNPDKQDTVTEVFVRGWKIDEPMMQIFKQCLPRLDRLTVINFWSTGLTDETLDILASLLTECPNIRHLFLDNNPVSSEGYDAFLKEESPVMHLSLRYNRITDVGAKKLGQLLGTPDKANSKLLSLNLNGNNITDKGMAALTQGLRMNRTLLSLGLANNKISNEGAKKISEVLSWFPLTHEEIVERRKLISEKGSPERNKSPLPGSRRADSRDNRPGSVRSSHAGGVSKAGKSAKNKKDGKGKEDEKHDKKHDKGKKEADKTQKKASIVADVGKTTTKKGDKGAKTKGKGPNIPEHEPDAPEIVSPLLDTVEHLDNGVIMLVGNRALINLNLSHNQIGEEGVKSLLSAVGYQTSLSQFQSHAKTGNMGLMRLCLTRNAVARDSDSLRKLNEIMETKDPFYKPPPTSPDQESTTQS